MRTRLSPPPNRTCTFQRIRLSTTARHRPLLVGRLLGMNGVMTGSAEHHAFAQARRPHIAGQSCISISATRLT